MPSSLRSNFLLSVLSGIALTGLFGASFAVFAYPVAPPTSGPAQPPTGDPSAAATVRSEASAWRAQLYREEAGGNPPDAPRDTGGLQPAGYLVIRYSNRRPA
ncbi:MAG TPA: hypothetical protein VMN57_16055 [Anaerolineales bacterium]|nr:hypothetical protein [Anaerolineales bacterium]